MDRMVLLGVFVTPKVKYSATLSVATWNMNSLDRYKLVYVCILLQVDNIDGCVMTDIRHSAEILKAYVRLLRDKLGAGTA